LPLMSKGENEAEDVEVAIKSKGGDCWHYGSGMISDVVLDGNTHGMALILIKIKKYAGEQFRRCVPAGMPCRDRVQIRGLPIHEVRTPVHTFQGS
jgi:hypothetical protein